MPNSAQTQLNHTLTLRIIELSILTLAFSLVIRPLFVHLSDIFLWSAVVNLILTISFYAVVRAHLVPKWEITLSLIVALIIIMPTLAISGGVNSQVAYFLPLYPIFAALIGGARESIAITVILVICTLFATVFGHLITDLTEEVYSVEKSLDRGFWLTTAIIFSAFFAHFFLRKYAELTKKLNEENTQDPLTSLLNRRGLNLYFSIELDKARVTTSPLSVILIDVDYFKKVNDMFGHDIGDICLIDIGNLLKSNLKNKDFIARFGGEEFIIILPNTSQGDAALIAEKLRNLVSKEAFSDFKLPLTITLGIAEYNDHNDNTLSIIKRADKALYKGKENGRNRVELSE
ncbi:MULTISPECIES: GGDEF domain-containing protein [Marinomonas]|uniref:diguanylate cyclase n=1 Tax=Marinomonas arctica TaxID=383750 RepID=A0A7H1J922_9GAMM|nr:MULTISPECIES: GGDEF domain-containing protein [Marinomonas]MCS7487272.1 diguanylate cyclase [Marinomonas sp. BSi20414]QNT06988.1 GGDEF domain-containing protein [Marinomonas arctica]GGN35468.1 hypothetical protein GCM10011350_32760 [Marinomonas arctica]